MESYPYGMNGQMKDNEVFEGFMSADFWGYDSRLGRRWETDPICYSWQSPYATFNNNPIYFADPLGLEGEDWYKGKKTGTVKWEEGNAKTIEKDGETYENIGETHTINDIVDGNLVTTNYYQNMIVGSSVKPIDYSAYENGKISACIENGLMAADRWIQKYKGHPFDGREYEGPDGVVQFDIGLRYKYNVAGMLQSQTEVKITSRHEDHNEFAIDNKTYANWKIGAANTLVNPFASMDGKTGYFSKGTVELFTKVSFSDTRKGDLTISQSMPTSKTGTYIKVNSCYNVIDQSIRIQSIEMGYTRNPLNTIETSLKIELIKLDPKKLKLTSIAD